MARFDGRVALVTGSARGQGRSHALGLAKEGADLVLNDICEDIPTVFYHMATREELDGVANEVRKIGRRALPIRADVSKSDQVRKMVDEAIRTFGRIDIAVINHGIMNSMGVTHETSEEEWDVMLDVNLKAPFLVSKYVVPHMIRQKYGRIIITSSNAGLFGFYGISSYAAAKHGVIGLVKTLAIELAPYNITVNAVAPCATNTTMQQEAVKHYPGWFEKYMFPASGRTMLFPDRSMNEPKDVTNGVLWLASEASRNVTGIVLPIDAGTHSR